MAINQVLDRARAMLERVNPEQAVRSRRMAPC
jgi:hypothetical protein